MTENKKEKIVSWYSRVDPEYVLRHSQSGTIRSRRRETHEKHGTKTRAPVKRIWDNKYWREVSDEEWIQHIRRNPNGKTAHKAKLDKDPDLELVNDIKTIEIKHDTKSKNIPKSENTLPSKKTSKDIITGSKHSAEYWERKGFTRAEEASGIGGRKPKEVIIKPLEKENKEQDEEDAS